MVARARKSNESFKKYRTNLISEAERLKWRLSTVYRGSIKGFGFRAWKNLKDYLAELRRKGLSGLRKAEATTATSMQTRQQVRLLDRAKVKVQRKTQRSARRVARGM